MNDISLNEWPLERICPVCGKRFCFQSVDRWGYHIGESYLCSYSCLKKLKNQREKRASMSDSAQLVRDGLSRGLSVNDIARETGLSIHSVYYHRRQQEKKK